jgi:hypothetical protein
MGNQLVSAQPKADGGSSGCKGVWSCGELVLERRRERCSGGSGCYIFIMQKYEIIDVID